MIQVVDLSKSFGNQVLFDRVSFAMTRGERLGLVGRNGHGKTTLLRILMGEEAIDEGKITMPSGYRIGHLAQRLVFTQETLLAEGCLGLPADQADDHFKVESILFGLGFTKTDLELPPSVFSGGYQIRLNLAKVLVSQPNLLLLDEPTNYLDIVSVRWLRRYLRAWTDELILITHDREFMDSVTTHTLAIHRQRVRKVEGGTQKAYDQLAVEEEVHEKTRRRLERQRREAEAFIDRFRAKASKASVVQSRIKALAKLPALDELTAVRGLDFQFTTAPFAAAHVLAAEHLTFAYPPRPDRTADPPPPRLIDGLSLHVGKRDRIGVIGKNGQGKSTLLRLLAAELTPTAGRVSCHGDARVGFFGQTNIDRLSASLTVEEEITSANPGLGRTRARTLCGIMMFEGDRAEKRIGVLSGGERSRVLLGKILAQPTNLLLLDEPTSHLDMESIEAMLTALDAYSGALIIVTHSERILRELCTRLVVFQHGGVQAFHGGYDDFLEKIGWEDEPMRRARTAPVAAPEERVAVAPSADAARTAMEDARPSLRDARAQPGDARVTTDDARVTSRKELRQRRSEIVRERSQVLGPLRKEMESLEAEIIALEERIRADNDALVIASHDGDGTRIANLAQTIKNQQRRVAWLFDRLEEATKCHESEAARFAAMLDPVA